MFIFHILSFTSINTWKNQRKVNTFQPVAYYQSWLRNSMFVQNCQRFESNHEPDL